MGGTRTFTARVILSGVTVGGMLDIAGLSRYRGAIAARYAAAAGFDALFLDVATSATFTSARVCVEVDADHDGIVDGTALAVDQIVILHVPSPNMPFATVPLVFSVPGYVCADGLTTLSPFAVLVDTMSLSTTTTSTSLPPGSTTTSTAIVGGTTTTTLPACATARDCLQQATSHPLCEETINPKLQKIINQKVAAARTKLGLAAAATKPAKAARFQKQARAAIAVIDAKADLFVNKKKGPISSACRDAIKRALAPVLGAIDASRL